MKILDMDVDNLPFRDFLSARCTVSVRINVENLWKYSKENNLSFFVMSLGALLESINEIPALKRRIIKDKVVEFDYLDAVSPLLGDDKSLLIEMCVHPPSHFDNILDWHEYVKKLQSDILSGKKEGFNMNLMERDETNIANFSCVPWIDFESVINPIAFGDQIQPLLTWGKVNESYEMPLSIAFSHIFAAGKDLAYFFDAVQDNFDNIFKK